MLNEREKNQPEDGGVMTPRQVRFLKIAIAIMSVLLVVGFMLFIFGIYRQIARSPGSGARATLTRPVELPAQPLNLPLKPGMQVGNVLADQGRLIVHLRGTGSDEIVVIDLASGGEQRITFAPQQ